MSMVLGFRLLLVTLILALCLGINLESAGVGATWNSAGMRALMLRLCGCMVIDLIYLKNGKKWNL